eukprot:10293641-Alexandrium_andersonii.AAC.1
MEKVDDEGGHGQAELGLHDGIPVLRDRLLARPPKEDPAWDREVGKLPNVRQALVGLQAVPFQQTQLGDAPHELVASALPAAHELQGSEDGVFVLDVVDGNHGLAPRARGLVVRGGRCPPHAAGMSKTLKPWVLNIVSWLHRQNKQGWSLELQLEKPKVWAYSAQSPLQ